MNEQQVTDKLISTILDFIESATDQDERRYVLIVAEPTLQKYVLNMERFGLFDEWWKNEYLLKEAKKFLKNPILTMISTLKQEVFGKSNGEVYTLYFHLRTPAQHYYKSIVKKKMSYLANNSSLVFVKLDKLDNDTKQEIEIFKEEYKPAFEKTSPVPNLVNPQGRSIT